MKKIIAVLLSCLFVCLLTNVSFAAKIVAEKKVEPKTAAKAEKLTDDSAVEKKSRDVKQMKKDEIVTDIWEALDEYEEIANLIPGLKKTTDKSGKTSYTFAGIKIEALDRARLEKLYIRVHQEKTRIHTENINRQLDTARRLQRIGTVPGGASRAVITSPAAPKIPPTAATSRTVPQAPRPPSAPALPPRR